MVDSLRQKLIFLAEEEETSPPWKIFRQLEEILKIAWISKSTELWQEMDRKISLSPDQGSDMDIVKFLTSGRITLRYPERAQKNSLKVVMELELNESILNKDDVESQVIIQIAYQIWYKFLKTYGARAIGIVFGDVAVWNPIEPREKFFSYLELRAETVIHY